MTQNSINNTFLGVGAEDAFNRYQNPGQTFAKGIDTSDANALKLTDGTDPSSGSVLWRMSTAGERTMPLQPAFSAYRNVSILNQTGAGAVVTVPFDTESFDQNGDYNNGTFTFTAPVTGRYFFTSTITFSALTAAMTRCDLFMNITGQSYWLETLSIGAIRDSLNEASIKGSIIAAMSTGDTATVSVRISNGAGDTATITGLNAGFARTTFSGYLVC